jgi:DNA-binding transcriptional LysR family regulator
VCASPGYIEANGRPENLEALAACDLVLAGNGIGLLTSFAIEAHLRRGELLHLFDDYTSNPVGIYAVYPHRKHLSPKVRRFIDLLVENFEPKFGLQAPR